MKLTKNQLIFGALLILLTVGFMYLLYRFIKNENHKEIIELVVLYAVNIFFAGFILGYFDAPSIGENKSAFRYHLITFCIVNVIGIPWFFVEMGRTFENGIIAFGQILGWGIGLLVHWFFTFYDFKMRRI